MKSKTQRLILTLGLLMLPVWVFSQTVNLMDMKKQEEERRRKTEKSKIVITDTNINSIETPATPYGLVQVQSGDVAGEDEAPPAGTNEGAPSAPSAEEALANPEGTAEYWKSQRDSLEQRIVDLEKAIADDESILNEQLNQGQQVGQIRKQMEADQAALTEARQGLEDLAERARKQGIPPGWLR